MVMKQIKFKSNTNNHWVTKDNWVGGILLNEHQILCGCCGKIVNADYVEWEELPGGWLDFSQYLIGEDINEIQKH